MESSLNKIVKIQHEIDSLLNKKNGVTCHFIDDGYELKLVTYNPTHGETFLLHGEPTKDSISSDIVNVKVYEKMLTYVKTLFNETLQSPDHKINNKSYTVIWNKSDGVENKSYFYAKDMWDVLSKFYYGKHLIKDSFNILEIKQNPSA
jgi:hypothetical protein